MIIHMKSLVKKNRSLGVIQWSAKDEFLLYAVTIPVKKTVKYIIVSCLYLVSTGFDNKVFSNAGICENQNGHTKWPLIRQRTM